MAVVARCFISWKKSFILRSNCLTFVRPRFSTSCKRCFHTNCHSKNNSRAPYQHGHDILPYSKIKLVVRPLVFTFVVGSGSFFMATILQYESMRSHIFNNAGKNFTDLRKKSFKIRQQLNKWWNSLHSGEKTAVAIIALNIGIFLLWKIPAFQLSMTKWFTSTPLSGLSLPMLLSCFSHIETWHLACNMVVLWSFSPVIHEMMGREQFLAFFISGGLVSAYFSHIFKLITRSYVPSLGASGCLLAVLGAVCVSNPDARLSILFLPFFSFSASKALIGLVTFDLAGLLFRWKLFDHAAHLGGIIFGSWYVLSGHKYLWDKRQVILRKWHEFRENSKK